MIARSLFVPILFAISLLSFPFAASGEIVGTYETRYVRDDGNTVRITLRCENDSACELEVEQSTERSNGPSLPLRRLAVSPLGGCAKPPQSEWDECMPHDWEHIRKAMAYARSHRDGAEAEELRKLVRPLLDSNADLQNCIDLHHGGSGFNMVCEMDQPLWDRPAVVFFQMILAPCRQDTLFCFVRFVPLFQSSPVATLKTRVSPYEQRPRRPGPDPRQVLVREYVEDLQSRIRSTMVLPPDTPPTAHLEYQIQFNQESGRTYSVNFQSGCYCPRLRRAFFDAVKRLEPLPTLPPERQVILGGKNGRVYVKFDASQTRQ